jgi:hypothetical protein
MGWGIEYLQSMIGGRESSVQDGLANIMGMIIGCITGLLINSGYKKTDIEQGGGIIKDAIFKKHKKTNRDKTKIILFFLYTHDCFWGLSFFLSSHSRLNITRPIKKTLRDAGGNRYDPWH